MTRFPFRVSVWLVVFVVAASAWSLPALSSEIQGRIDYVFDGDTISVRGVKVRLNGLHAPEYDEPGGQAAKN